MRWNSRQHEIQQFKNGGSYDGIYFSETKKNLQTHSIVKSIMIFLDITTESIQFYTKTESLDRIK